MDHAYPGDFARFIRERWAELRAFHPEADDDELGLPETPALEELLSTTYQATLLQEEERAVTFRLIIVDPELIPIDGGPPVGLHRLTFSRPRRFTEHELRRLSPAVKYHRALIGVRRDGDGGFLIWGILQSGPRWLQSSRGGRSMPSPLPPQALVIRAMGPGRIVVARGPVTLGELRGGSISSASMDMFDAEWLGATFAASRSELMELHAEAEAAAGGSFAPLDPDVTRLLGQQMVKRLISTMRSARHGGTLIFLPPSYAELVSEEDQFIRLKYKFREEEPRRRYRTLILSIMRTLAESTVAGEPSATKVGWSAYIASPSPTVARLDEAFFEMANLIASLADVDGAVVMTKRFELLGFGGEIGGDLPEVITVERALDLEGTVRESVPAEGVGTRHRSAYRLCQRVRDALAIVVSQDSGVRFIAWKDGAVTYWDHVSAGAPDG